MSVVRNQKELFIAVNDSVALTAYGAGCYQSGVIARKNKDGKTATVFPFPEVERI